MSSESEDVQNKSAAIDGKYTLVGVDIDTTGRRLIDEIVQLSAYTPDNQFSQYVMPYMNLNPAARQRHQVRVITIGFFRMLKSMQTYKVVKTKSEYAALNEFLEWLENIKNADEDSQGVILIYHEQRKFIPYMLLEALKKYKLLPRFQATVQAFVNGYSLTEQKCGNSLKYFSLRQLSKVLLNQEADESNDKNQFEGNASVRARLTYEIAQYLAQQLNERQDVSPETDTEMFGKVMQENASPVSEDISELAGQQEILERQNSLRPIFLNYFKTTLYHRVKAVTFRRVLAEQGNDLDSLQKLWETSKKEGIVSAVEKCEEIKSDDKTELIEILDCHFDPEKQAIKPLVRKSKRRLSTRSGPRVNAKGNKENVKPKNGIPELEGNLRSPDSTIKSPEKAIHGKMKIEMQTNKALALNL